MLGVVRMVVLLPIRGLKLEVRVDILPVWGVTPVSTMASGSIEERVCEECVIN